MNGRLQNTLPAHGVGAKGIQVEVRTAKDKLERHREMRPEEHGHYLGGTVGRWDRMASTCGTMHPTERGMNRTEQQYMCFS